MVTPRDLAPVLDDMGLHLLVQIVQKLACFRETHA
jgi:hypothetical protein